MRHSLAQSGRCHWSAWCQWSWPCGQDRSALRSLCAAARMAKHRPVASGLCHVGVAPFSIWRSQRRALRGGSVQPAAQADSRRQAAARGLASSLYRRLRKGQVRMVRFARERRSADCQGRSSLCGAAWRSSVANAGPSGAGGRGRVAKVGRGFVLFARRPAWSSTGLSPRASATWVWLRLASGARNVGRFEVARYNLPLKPTRVGKPPLAA